MFLKYFQPVRTAARDAHKITTIARIKSNSGDYFRYGYPLARLFRPGHIPYHTYNYQSIKTPANQNLTIIP